ncbi:MAG TPA: TetR/AcrR family transcriptional regulator [Phenylobacterium sp.]|nr:TetR/AcrR family transcriptional regulator [Phenylobacterium sp.]
MVERRKALSAAAGARTATEQAPPPMGRRERNKQEKLARIVQAARVLFGEKGFAETTTQQIAEAADIGTGTLFLYARSKEDLLVMVFKDEMIETARAAFEQLREGDPLLDQLVQLFSSMMGYHARDPDLARILLKEIMFPAAPDRAADITELLQFIYGELGELVTDAQKSGDFRPGADPILVAENLFANYYMDLMAWLGGGISMQQFPDRLRQHLAITISAGR